MLIAYITVSAEESASSVTANLQQLNIEKDDVGAPPEEDGLSVVIPNHLQLHTPDCLHLSFGSFGSGTGAAISGSGSGSFASRPLNSNLEEASTTVDVSAIGHSETRYVMMMFPVLYLLVFWYCFSKYIFLAEILNIMTMSISGVPQMKI